MLTDNLHTYLTEQSSGILQLGGARMALLEVESGFWGIRRQIEALIGSRLTNSVLQQAGTNGGASFAKTFIGQAGADQATAFAACLQAYQAAGFGQFEIVSMEWPLGRIQIRATNAFEAWMFQQQNEKTNSPICAYSAGVLVGFVNIIGERQDIVCLEHTCQAKGDDACLFELVPASDAQGQTLVSTVADPGLGRQINLLEMLFERMPMGIAIFDRNYHIQRYNPTWQDFATRYAPSTAGPLAPGIFYFDQFPGSEKITLPMFEKVLAGETIRGEGLRFESVESVSYWDVVLAPLLEEGEIRGILNVTADATERVLLQQNLEKRVEERTRELNRKREIAESLRDIIGMINSNIPLASFLERAVKLATQQLGAAACTLHHFDLDKQFMTHVASYGMEGVFEKGEVRPFRDLKASGGDKYLQATMQRQPTYSNYPPLPQRIDEIKNDPSIPDSIKAGRIALRQKFAGSFSVPLFIQDQVYGGLAFYYTEPQEFSEEHVQLGMTFAEQMAVAIENARLLQETARRRQVAEGLRDILAVLNSGRPLDEILDHIVAQAVRLLGAQSGVVYRLKADPGLLQIQAGYQVPENLTALEQIPLYRGEAVQQMWDLKPYAIRNLQEHLAQSAAGSAFSRPSLAKWLGILAQHYGAYLGVPLVIDDEVYGSLGLYYSHPQSFDDEEIELGMALANQAVLAIQNARLHQAEQDRQRELQMLLDVASTASTSLDLDEMLAQTLELVVALLEASHAGVLLVDEESGELVPHTLRPQADLDYEALAPFMEACQTIIVSGKSLYVATDAEQRPRGPGALLPLQTRGQTIGVLAIIGSAGGSFSQEQLTLFKSIADQLSVAIDNARLFDQVRKVAVTAERNRLARDLHDAVTQTLFSSSMIADVLPKIWERDPEEGLRRLEEVRQLTRGALSEMRTLLLELRPAALVDMDLGDLIGHQINAFNARTRVSVGFDQSCRQNPPLDVKEMFYRIAQETLNNIAKHADATTVKVQLDCQPGRAELSIHDDGVGFDLESASAQGLGLNIMQERARNVGAHLEIHSQLQAGTRIRLCWQEPEKEYTND